MNPIDVHTIGDSTLDNVYWLLNENGTNIQEAKTQCVEGQLQIKLNEGNNHLYQVVSHAYDGFTTESLLNGDTVGRVLPGIAPKRVSKEGRSYLQCKGIDPLANSFEINPLSKMKSAVMADPEATHYVVLSVGGNDFREQLLNPIKMLGSIPEIHKRYDQILNVLKNDFQGKKIKPILMLQYRLDANNDAYWIYTILRVIGAVTLAINALSAAALIASLGLLSASITATTAIIFALLGAVGLMVSNKILPLRLTWKVLSGQEVGMAALGALMERFYQPILKRAKEESIPILDLPNTFNPYKPLYIASIEPNVEGGKLIAEGINHIVKNHDYHSSSKLYAKSGSQTEFSASDNPGYSGWRVKSAR
ncbi:MAG: hypothetical protein ACHQUC_10615 [Chlamydiales bacterium]